MCAKSDAKEPPAASPGNNGSTPFLNLPPSSAPTERPNILATICIGASGANDIPLDTSRICSSPITFTVQAGFNNASGLNISELYQSKNCINASDFSPPI